MSRSKLKDLQKKDTRSAYCKVGCDLVTYCLGIVTGQITEPKTTFTPEMSDAGHRLLASLKTLSFPNQDNALQDFLFTIFSQKQCGEPNKYGFPAYGFLVAYSFTEHGNLRACGYFTQYFSKVIFFARATI